MPSFIVSHVCLVRIILPHVIFPCAAVPDTPSADQCMEGKMDEAIGVENIFQIKASVAKFDETLSEWSDDV